MGALSGLPEQWSRQDALLAASRRVEEGLPITGRWRVPFPVATCVFLCADPGVRRLTGWRCGGWRRNRLDSRQDAAAKCGPTRRGVGCSLHAVSAAMSKGGVAGARLHRTGTRR